MRWLIGLNKINSFRTLLNEKWSRGPQGSRPRPRTQKKSEAKDSLIRGQILSRPRTQAQVLSKKKVFTKIFQAISTKNTFSQKFFQALHKILTIQKLVLSSSRGQANFRGLEAKDFKMCPRGRPGGQGRPRGLHLCFPILVI